LLVAPFILVTLGAPAAPAGADITAVAPSAHVIGIGAPDAQGRVTLRVRISDLDPASPAGWRMMDHRVALGTALLCDAVGAAPAYGGYYAHDQRQCRAETREVAQAQMMQARDQASAGMRLSYLDLSR